ncbi:hypothetical protein M5689_024197 [Euphorbia peplus]|nr:hypothetical protein M5689_024197 [Euphorbia peplus]
MLHPGPTRNFYRSSPDFGPEKKLIPDVNDKEDDPGVYSPPLWRTSPPRNHYRNLSPSSRAQAIARGQKELMEMVGKMPEGCYELSLKDIVEQSFVDPVKEENETRIIMKKKNENKKVQQQQQQMSRSGSMEHNGGFLLKILFPVSLGSTKKKKMVMNKGKSSSKSSNGESGRVSPRPLLVDGGSKGVENEWWKNRFIEVEESESGGLSSNSGSSKSSGSSTSRNSSRNSNAWHGGVSCWAFMLRKRGNKPQQHKQE